MQLHCAAGFGRCCRLPARRTALCHYMSALWFSCVQMLKNLPSATLTQLLGAVGGAGSAGGSGGGAAPQGSQVGAFCSALNTCVVPMPVTLT